MYDDSQFQTYMVVAASCVELCHFIPSGAELIIFGQLG